MDKKKRQLRENKTNRPIFEQITTKLYISCLTKLFVICLSLSFLRSLRLSGEGTRWVFEIKTNETNCLLFYLFFARNLFDWIMILDFFWSTSVWLQICILIALQHIEQSYPIVIFFFILKKMWTKMSYLYTKLLYDFPFISFLSFSLSMYVCVCLYAVDNSIWTNRCNSCLSAVAAVYLGLEIQNITFLYDLFSRLLLP